MSDARSFVIVGAGQAGRWLAVTLREQGFDGRIVWFGDEGRAPYERPSLSKEVLLSLGGVPDLALLSDDQRIALRAEEHFDKRIVAIDRRRRIVHSEDGAEFGYDTLFLANGGHARTLPKLMQHPRIATLRTIDDALRIRRALADTQRVIVVGGGWIGLEVAASARTLGCEVTLVEAAPRLCVRSLPPCVAEHLLAIHRERGVDVRLADGVSDVASDEQGVAVTLVSGAHIDGGLLVVGVGMTPNDRLAAEAGIATANGILTDQFGRTDDPHVYAVGDVANSLRTDGNRMRLESWENAQIRAVAAARFAIGRLDGDEIEQPPWFWSDQYDDNLQVLGLPNDMQRVIQRCVPSKRQRVFFFCEGASVRAVAGVNAGREVKIVRRWMLQHRYPDLESLADPTLDLSKLPTLSNSA